MLRTKASAILCIFLLLHVSAAQQGQGPICPFQAIYQFGDSISDTGNLILEGPVGAASYAARLPYGETTFHRPTGRCSNGLLMIDYLATALQLPLLNPYLKRGVSFDHGVNFAVAGSTAIDSSFFTARGIRAPSSDSPLSRQLYWFRTHLSSVCHTSGDCARILRRALFLVGEIGGNDYNYAFFQGKPIEEIRTYVPYVVGAIVNAVREVIRLGAVRIVVPGNFPVGCFPIYLSSFPSTNPLAYDDKGCLSGLNEFASYHNSYLQQSLALLRQEFPHAVILYGDYYTAFQSVLRNPYLRFDQTALLRACCGTGGLYNYDGSRMCGSPGVFACPNPHQHISWDGVHLTQEAYHHMSEFLISSILSNIQCV